MGNSFKIVLAGCGGISHSWIKAIQKRTDAQIIGLVDLNSEAANAHKKKFGLEQALVGIDLEEILKKVKPDIVFDCTVPSAHVSVTLAALQHGCHVLGEKPLADTIENARKMVRAAKKAKKIYAVMQNRRSDPNIRRLQRFLQSGSLGPITTVQSNFFIGAHFGGFRDKMKHVLLLDMAIHTFDAARFITSADPEAVYCHEWNPSGSWYAQDASAVVIFKMSKGIRYAYHGSWCSEGLHTTWEADWRIICEKGSILWDGGQKFQVQKVKATGKFMSELEDIPMENPPDMEHTGHAGVIHNFLDCLMQDKIPETVCTDNIKSLSMVLGAIESAEKKQRVRIKI